MPVRPLPLWREGSELNSSSRTTARVRFAPSPTGALHVGGARTAIFNWIYARQREGRFILRIEDTDVERSTWESEAALIDDLKWLGLDWDEGPDTAGPCAPYRQSERLLLYREEAEQLVRRKRAYPCFCSDEVLDAKRAEAVKQGDDPKYDGTCRSLTAGEVEAKRKKGIPEVVRFVVRDGDVRFRDLIRGNIELGTSMVGDFVLIRSNGHPTYNFSAAVDDQKMGVTQVLRGEEHLPNTLRQLLIYEALNAPAPEFGHLPIILAADRSKLSKRHGASSIGELRRMGFLPEAVVNYLALLGWSHKEGKDLFDVGELVREFSLERVSKSAAIYDRKKLHWMNGQYIRRKDGDELFLLADRFLPDDIKSLYAPEKRREILRLLRDGIESFADLASRTAVFRDPPELDGEAADVLASGDSGGVLETVGERLRDVEGPLTAPAFKLLLKEVGKITGKKGKELYFPVRAAITGSVHGPDLAGVAAVRGKEAVIRLIERTLSG